MGGQLRWREADRHAAAQALQCVNAVVGLAVVAVMDRIDRRNSADARCNQCACEFIDLRLTADQRATL
ncbi:hypothetical protein D3C81_2160760 [compost metagenome]